MKPRHIAMGGALALASSLVIFGDTTPDATLAEPVERVAAAPASAPARTMTPSTPGNVTGDVTTVARLIPRDALIGAEGDRFGDGDNALFARQDWTPPPPPPSNEPPPPPPPPRAPPLPFKFIGKSLQDGVWEIYLARNDQTFLVRTGTTIEGAYRVDAIRPPVLTLTYLPLDQVQQLNIGVFD